LVVLAVFVAVTVVIINDGDGADVAVAVADVVTCLFSSSTEIAVAFALDVGIVLTAALDATGFGASTVAIAAILIIPSSLCAIAVGGFIVVVSDMVAINAFRGVSCCALLRVVTAT
jgi:hypothetical protein